MLPTPPAGRGLTRSQRLRRRVGRTLAGAGCVEVINFPFVGEAAFDALGLPADDVLPAHRAAGQPDVAPRSRRTPRPCCRTCSGPRPATWAAAPPGSSLFETGVVAFPADRGPAPIYGVEWRPSEDELAKLMEALPAQPLHLARGAGRRARAGRLVGRGPRRHLGGRGRRRPPAGRRARGRRRGALRGPRRRGTPAAAPQVLVGDQAFGHAGELHPKVCQAFGLPERSAAVEIDLDFLLAPRRRGRAGADLLELPAGQGGRRARRRRRRPTVAEVEAALREGAGELLESIRLFDVYTGEQVGAGKKSLAFALRFRAPDRTLTEQETSAARDAAVALAAERTRRRPALTPPQSIGWLTASRKWS